MLRSSLRGTLVGCVVLATALAILGFCLLSFGLFERALVRTAEGRLTLIGSEVMRTVDAGFNVGIPLERQTRLRTALAENRHRMTELAAIEVVDEKGRIAFSTNDAEIGEPAPAHWRAADLPATTNRWRVETDDELIVAIRIWTLFQTDAGYVALRLPRSAIRVQLDRFGIKLAVVGLIALVVTTVVVTGVAMARRWAVVAAVDNLEARMEQLYEDARESQSEASPAPADLETVPGPISTTLASFDAMLAEQARRMRRDVAEIRHLDELA